MKKSFWGRFLPLIAVIAVLLSYACSTTLTSGSKTEDIKSIVGKWEGWGTLANGTRTMIKLTIAEDGKWQMSVRPPYYSYGGMHMGNSYYNDGKFIFETETPGLTGNA
ncbi:MAG TPA: hypothetical protein VLS90_14715, partial [Thermodesulfobacteriota bacterium]|nr:hypothetical protein [Thermodesulfobacteriota bacterium]